MSQSNNPESWPTKSHSGIEQGIKHFKLVEIDGFSEWYEVGICCIKLMKVPKNAWLIGLYTNEMEHRIKRLGYKLVRYFPDANFTFHDEAPPQMIVFSEHDTFSTRSMHRLREMFPEAILISLSLYLPSEDPAHHRASDATSNFSLIRLLKSIETIEERY